MLNRIVRKSLLKSYKLLIAIFLLFTVAQMLYVADKITYPVLQDDVVKFYDETNVEDFRIYALDVLKDKYDMDWQKEIEDKYDLNLEANEYYHIKADPVDEGSDTTTDENTDVGYGIVKYNENNVINEIYLEEGDYPTQEGEIVLPYTYAKNNNISVGDMYSVYLDRDLNIYENYEVSGIGYFVDYIYPLDMTSGDMSISGGHQFVPVYMNSKSFDFIAPEDKTVLFFSGKFNKVVEDKESVYKSIKNDYTYALPLTDENGDPQKDKNGALITQSINLVPVILDIENNASIYAANQEIDGEETMLNMLSLVILFIALIIIIVLFNNIFSSQKKEMGILKASGISQHELSIRYTGYLIFLLVVASFVGVLIGVSISGAIVNFITSIYYFPLITSQSSVYSLGLMTTIPTIILVVVAVYFIAIRKNLKKEAILLLKNIESDKPPKIKIPIATDNMKFINKYKLNILLRNLGISLLLVFGVFVSSFLLLMGGTIRTSVNKAINSATESNYTYEYKVEYSEGMRDPNYGDDSLILENSTVIGTSTDAIIKPSMLTPNGSPISIYSYDFVNNDYIRVLDENENVLDPNTIYATQLAMKKYNLEVGDAITIVNPYDANESMNLFIGGVIDNGVSSRIYMDLNMTQKLFDLENNYANAHVGVDLDKKGIEEYDKEASISEIKTGDTDLGATMQIINSIVAMISGVAIFISTITLTIITAIIISKNKKTISIMKVMGYTDKEINSMVLSPYKWILIGVYFISIPGFQYMIQTLINASLADMDVSVTIRIDPKATIIGFVAIFIIYFIALVVSKRSISKISLAESLKMDE